MKNKGSSGSNRVPSMATFVNCCFVALFSILFSFQQVEETARPADLADVQLVSGDRAHHVPFHPCPAPVELKVSKGLELEEDTDDDNTDTTPNVSITTEEILVSEKRLNSESELSVANRQSLIILYHCWKSFLG